MKPDIGGCLRGYDWMVSSKGFGGISGNVFEQIKLGSISGDFGRSTIGAGYFASIISLTLY